MRPPSVRKGMSSACLLAARAFPTRSWRRWRSGCRWRARITPTSATSCRAPSKWSLGGRARRSRPRSSLRTAIARRSAQNRSAGCVTTRVSKRLRARSSASTTVMLAHMPLTTPRSKPQGAEEARALKLASGAKRPHVCFLAPTTWPLISRDRDIKVVGGAEVQQSIIAPALARRGYRVSMICFDYGQPDKVEIDGVTIYKIPRPDEGVPIVRFLHPRLTSLWRALTRADADVYYQRTAAAYTGFLAAFWQRQGRPSIYAGASDVDFIPGKQDIRYARDRWLFEWGLKRMSRIVVQNPAQQASLRGHYGLDSVLIPSCYAAPAGAHAERSG